MSVKTSAQVQYLKLLTIDSVAMASSKASDAAVEATLLLLIASYPNAILQSTLQCPIEEIDSNNIDS